MGETTSNVVEVVTSLPSRKRGMVEAAVHSRAGRAASLVVPLAAIWRCRFRRWAWQKARKAFLSMLGATSGQFASEAPWPVVGVGRCAGAAGADQSLAAPNSGAASYASYTSSAYDRLSLEARADVFCSS